MGCGEGIFAEILFQDKVDVGVDPQSNELNRAAEFNKYRKLEHCFGDLIPYGDGHFKTVFSNSVLEHIEDLSPVLQEIHRVLALDGVLYATVPTHRFDEYSFISQILGGIGLKSLQAKWRSFFNRFWAHYHYYTPEEWEKYFSVHGFVMIESLEYCSRIQGVSNDILAPLSLVSFAQKKVFNRWFIFPVFRKIYSWVLKFLWRPMSNVSSVAPGEGGIIFFKFEKVKK